jgi:ATP-dependent helicase/nuclease subunit A
MPDSIISRAVLSPAGSGKTERLARRYIELLQAGSPPERILTITFTEKAAAEMKERIFRILRKEDPALLRRLKSRVLKLRISTIHSFCLNLVQRFSSELGLEPDLQTLAAPEDLWYNTEYDLLMQIAEQGTRNPDYACLLDFVTAGRMSGWSLLARNFSGFFEQRTSIERATVRPTDFEHLVESAQVLRTDPTGTQHIPDYAELFPGQFDTASLLGARKALSRVEGTFLTTGMTPRKRGPKGFPEWCAAMSEYWRQVNSAADHEEFRLMLDLFQRVFLKEYDRRKQQQGLVDFDDMERLAWRLLTENDEWSNILLAFDEHTDHILVDEFQDTSYLQWGIIEKLTEEWRSGEGRRTELKVKPTIFIVGDDKQSIYLFRKAHAEVFSQAEQTLRDGFGAERFKFDTVETNFRSLSRIIDFTNHVFGRLMNPKPDEPLWCTRYSPFRRERKNKAPGRVELLLASGPALNASERHELEAGMIADRVLSLHGQQVTFDESEQPVACDWQHVTILLRNRTHLQAYEQALASRGIPYLVQHGTGFYDEPETLLLKALLAVLVDPYDDLALYALLRSPLFLVPEPDLYRISRRPGNTFFDRMAAYESPAIGQTLQQLAGWIGRVNRRPLAEIMEGVLTEQNAWTLLWEPQRRANARKFLQLIEDFENQGMHPLRIKTTLDTLAEDQREAKASIDVRGQNAVQLMTIHNAKGLQFPIVFVPLLDNDITGRSKPLLIREEGPNQVLVSYIDNREVRRQDEWFQEYRRREEEEEKRLFYVACTRARDALFLSGIAAKVPPTKESWLKWLWEILELKLENQRFWLGAGVDFVELLNPDEIPKPARAAGTGPEPQAAEPETAIGEITEPAALHLSPVTRDTTSDRKRHGEDTIAFGTVMHQILERISRVELDPTDTAAVTAQARRLFDFEGVEDELCRKHCPEVVRQLNALRESGLLEIVLPQPDSYAELPFMLRREETILSGRIDRLIVRRDTVDVYDYKTFPVKPGELPGLVAEYQDRQMNIYLDTAQKLFPGKKPRGFLIFTAKPELVPL